MSFPSTPIRFYTIDILRRIFISQRPPPRGLFSWMNSSLVFVDAKLFSCVILMNSLRVVFLIGDVHWNWMQSSLGLVRSPSEIELYLTFKRNSRRSSRASCGVERNRVPRDRQIRSHARRRRRASRTTAKSMVSSCRLDIWCIVE